MTAKIISGSELAEAQNIGLARRVSAFKSAYGRAPSLHVLLVMIKLLYYLVKITITMNNTRLTL